MGQPGRGVGACEAGARPGAGQQLARGALTRSGHARLLHRACGWCGWCRCARCRVARWRGHGAPLLARLVARAPICAGSPAHARPGWGHKETPLRYFPKRLRASEARFGRVQRGGVAHQLTNQHPARAGPAPGATGWIAWGSRWVSQGAVWARVQLVPGRSLASSSHAVRSRAQAAAQGLPVVSVRSVSGCPLAWPRCPAAGAVDRTGAGRCGLTRRGRWVSRWWGGSPAQARPAPHPSRYSQRGEPRG